MSALGLLLLAGCANFVPSASHRYDGVYELIATPIPPSSPDISCAPFTQNVVVEDGGVEVATHGTTLHGTIGEITPRGRTFALASGIDVPGGVEDGSDNSCQWHYRFQYEGTAQEVPGVD